MLRRRKNKVLRFFARALSLLLSFLLLALLISNILQPLFYKDYYKRADREFLAPGLVHGLVPQGFCFEETSRVFLSCGYMTNSEKASRIYITDGNGKNARFVELFNEDGSPYTGHTGGIAASESKVFLANDGEGDDNCVWVLDLEELLNNETGKMTLKTRFFPETRAACCFIGNGALWVGEFYDEEKYPTKESHHITAPTGEENPSLICSYGLDNFNETGIFSTIPDRILSVRGKLQGFAFLDGKIYISTSYGLNNSHLYVYSEPFSEHSDLKYEIDGVPVSVWCLDSENLIEDITLPPMSEELAVKNNKVYILYESASQKYVFGNFLRGPFVYSIDG